MSRNKDGYDIISNAGDRLTEYKKRCEVKGLIGIPTGIPKLDEITNGWLWGEDLVVLTGRTNVGKTWIGEYFATVAWNMGYKILMYSGEMSTAMVGFRFDTLNKHFSNMGLLNGSGTLGKKPDTDGAKYLQEDYEKYITQLQQKSGFIVVTPDDFEGRKPNVDEIKSLAIKHGADMIVIDQLSLMSDKRRADIPRIAYNNISEDLFLMSKELKKPVLLMAQANREAVKNRKKGESPELHDLAESDGVGQNATRVLSLSVIDGTLKISVKKNRYGIPSCGVLLQQKVTKDKTYEAGTVHCYTCGYTADLPQFVADLLGLSSPVEGFKWLVNQYNYQTEERELPDLDMYRGCTAKSSVLEESLVKQYTQNLLQSEEACSF